MRKQVSTITEKAKYTDPKEYMDYIIQTYGEALVYGDGTNPLYDKGIEDCKKLAKMMGKKYQDVLQQVIDKCSK